MSKWFFAIDRGGTFTDVIGIDPSNKLHKLKLLSESLLYEDSVIEGIRRLLKLNSNLLSIEEVFLPLVRFIWRSIVELLLNMA